jgi:hypothetical protein
MTSRDRAPDAERHKIDTSSACRLWVEQAPSSLHVEPFG